MMVKQKPTWARGLRRNAASACSMASSGWPAQCLKQALTYQPRAEARIKGQCAIDQGHHRADVLAEERQRQGGVGEDARGSSPAT